MEAEILEEEFCKYTDETGNTGECTPNNLWEVVKSVMLLQMKRYADGQERHNGRSRHGGGMVL